MPLESKGSNAVITARQFNPAVFSQAWLIENLHVAAADFVAEGTTQIPMVFTSQTRRFHLLVLPERLQFMPQPGQEHEGDLVGQTVGEIVRRLPEVDYTAIGLNFSWAITGYANNVLTRRMFFFEHHPLCREFASEDAGFGAYYSKNSLGFRLKLDVKPAATQPPDAIEHFVVFNFNYHQDLAGEDKVGQIERLVRQWDATKADATRIMEMVNREFVQ